MTNQPEIEMQELLDLARDKSVTGRTRLVQVVGDLFFDEDGVLIEIIQHRTFEHQLPIAMREAVSEAVSDALVETGNTQVIKTLIENQGAQISDNTMEYLVGESKTKEAYQEPLLERPELSPRLAKRMYWWVSAALRKHIAEHYKIDPTELDQKIESTIKEIRGEPDPNLNHEGEIDENALAHSSRLAQKLAANNAITPALLLQTLRKGEVRMFEGMFAQITGLRQNLVRRLIFEPGGEGLAIACKAIAMSKPDFGSLFLLSRSARPGDKTVDPNEVARAMAFFDRMQPDTAKKVLARWKLDPDYLFAIKQVDKGSNQKALAAE